MKHKTMKLFILGQGQLIGDEDIVVKSKGYQTTVRCLSKTAEYNRFSSDEFLKL